MNQDAKLMAATLMQQFCRLNDTVDKKNVSLEKLNTLSRIAKAYSALMQPGLTLEKAIDGKSYTFGLMVSEE